MYFILSLFSNEQLYALVFPNFSHAVLLDFFYKKNGPKGSQSVVTKPAWRRPLGLRVSAGNWI